MSLRTLWLKVEWQYILLAVVIEIFFSKNLQTESFGGGIKHPPRINGANVVFVKGVSTTVDTQQFIHHLNNQGIGITEARRLTNRTSGKPTQVIKVWCSREVSIHLLNDKISINGITCVVEKQRKVRVIRCYNCQNLGHIARNCTNKHRCEFCSLTHANDTACSGVVLCANCGGSHPSSSSKCPTYISRYEDLTKQYSKC